MKVLSLTAAFVLAMAVHAEPVNPLTMRLLPGFVAPAPAQLQVLATIEAHIDNRELEVVAQSPTFYRSSTITLDGDRAPRLNEFRFRNLPSGQYEVTAILIGSQGRARAVQSRHFHVSDEVGR